MSYLAAFSPKRERGSMRRSRLCKDSSSTGTKPAVVSNCGVALVREKGYMPRRAAAGLPINRGALRYNVVRLSSEAKERGNSTVATSYIKEKPSSRRKGVGLQHDQWLQGSHRAKTPCYSPSSSIASVRLTIAVPWKVIPVQGSSTAVAMAQLRNQLVEALNPPERSVATAAHSASRSSPKGTGTTHTDSMALSTNREDPG